MSTEVQAGKTDLTGQMSIYARAPIIEVLACYNHNRSQRLNAVCERYLAAMCAACPALALAEWGVVCDALEDLSNMETQGSSGLHLRTIRLLWAEVADADAARGLARKWEVNTDLLISALRGMNLAEKIAVVEVAEMFWNQKNGGNTAEALRRAGARIAIDSGLPEEKDDVPFA